MEEAKQTLMWFRTQVEDAIWDIVAYVVTNRTCLNFTDVKNRCEKLIAAIDEYKRLNRQVEVIFRELTNDGQDRDRKMAQRKHI